MNDMQFKAVTSVKGPVLILAGAGSGKTTAILQEIAALCAQGEGRQVLLVPELNYSAFSMTVSFCLLGIGNAIMQVSLNPLVVNIVSGDRLASTMTFGQFVKAICSFIAPLVASWGAVQFDNWRVMFPIFMAVAVIAVVSLGLTNIREGEYNGTGGFKASFSLLGAVAVMSAGVVYLLCMYMALRKSYN